MGRASGVGARCWGTPVEFGCLLTYRQLISGCRAVRNLSPTGALFLFHDVRLYDPERRLVRGPPRKGLGMCRRVTNKGESGFGIANDRGTVAVEWKHHRRDRLKRRRDLSVEVSVLRGWDPKVPVGSPVSFPKRSNQAWRLVAPLSPCRINTKSKHHNTQLLCRCGILSRKLPEGLQAATTVIIGERRKTAPALSPACPKPCLFVKKRARASTGILRSEAK